MLSITQNRLSKFLQSSSILLCSSNLTSYNLFNKLANLEDEKVQAAETFEEKSKLVSAKWKLLSDKAKEKFRHEVSELTETASSSPISNDATTSTEEMNDSKNASPSCSLIPSIITQSEEEVKFIRKTAERAVLELGEEDGELLAAEKVIKRKSVHSKRRSLSSRDRFFKERYSQTKEFPFHKRLAILHTEYAKKLHAERLRQASRRSTPDRTAQLYAWLTGYGNKNLIKNVAENEARKEERRQKQHQDRQKNSGSKSSSSSSLFANSLDGPINPEIMKKSQDLLRLYRKSVSSSVKRRGPPIR